MNQVQVKVNADEFSNWLSDIKTIRVFIEEAKNGTVWGSFARQRLLASIQNIDRVIDEMKDAYRRSF